jgi:hypothetical protein
VNRQRWNAFLDSILPTDELYDRRTIMVAYVIFIKERTRDPALIETYKKMARGA